MIQKIKFFIKDFWEDFYYMNEGSSPKYWINNVIWYVWFTSFIVTMFIAGALGALFWEIQCWWYKFKTYKNTDNGL